MRHARSGKKLGRDSAHRKALYSNLAGALIEHGRIKTTVTKAKAVKPIAEQMITLGRRGDLHARRQATSFLRDAKAQIVTGAPVVSIEGDAVLCRSGEGIVRHPTGDRIVLAIGSAPVREVAQLADEAGVPWVMAGDCNNVPGDFLTAIRDASMNCSARSISEAIAA